MHWLCRLPRRASSPKAAPLSLARKLGRSPSLSSTCLHSTLALSLAISLFLSRSLSLFAALAPSVPKCRSPWLSLSPRSLGDSGKSTAGRRDVSDALSQSERMARLGGTSLAKLSSSLAKQPQPRGVGRSSGWFTLPPTPTYPPLFFLEDRKRERGE